MTAEEKRQDAERIEAHTRRLLPDLDTILPYVERWLAGKDLLFRSKYEDVLDRIRAPALLCTPHIRWGVYLDTIRDFGGDTPEALAALTVIAL